MSTIAASPVRDAPTPPPHGELDGGLSALGLSPGDAARLFEHGAVRLEDARVLIQDVGCPPSLAADILLWARELEPPRP